MPEVSGRDAGSVAMNDELLEAVARTSTLLRNAQDEVSRLARIRQNQVLQLRSRGVSYGQIAERLGVTRSAVQQILRRTY